MNLKAATFCFCLFALTPSAHSGILTGVAFGDRLLSGVPANWQAVWGDWYSGGTPTSGPLVLHPGNLSLGNLIDETGSFTGYSINVVAPGAFLENFQFHPPLAESVPIHSPSLGTLETNIFDGRSRFGTHSFSATFSDLAPFQAYNVYAFGLWIGGPYTQTVTISSETGPITLTQTGADRLLYINGAVGSSSRELEDYAEVAVADAAGSITVTFQGSSGGSFTPAGVALETVTPEPASGTLIILAAAVTCVFRQRNASRGIREN